MAIFHSHNQRVDPVRSVWIHLHIIIVLVGGWALPLWKMMEFVSWDYDIPNIWKNKINVPHHQPVVASAYRWFFSQIWDPTDVPCRAESNLARLANEIECLDRRKESCPNPRRQYLPATGGATRSFVTSWEISPVITRSNYQLLSPLMNHYSIRSYNKQSNWVMTTWNWKVWSKHHWIRIGQVTWDCEYYKG